MRTAFPTTGGFDEQVTLICLHAADATSRAFSRLLTDLAGVRSVYAPDLPGHGESDSSPTRSIADAALAIADLASDLRLRQIDLLGVQSGAEVALAPRGGAARTRAARWSRWGPAVDRSSPAKHQRLMIDIKTYGDDPSAAAAQTLARQIGSFLFGQP